MSAVFCRGDKIDVPDDGSLVANGGVDVFFTDKASDEACQ